MKELHIEYPDEVLEATRESEASFQELARELVVVKLYELGRLSSGLGARVLGISRREFLQILSRYQVSLFDPASGSSLNE